MPVSETIDVALISMPWAPPTEPCLGLSILAQCLHNERITASVFHMAPVFLRWCTIETYAFVADQTGFNEFIFTGIIDSAFDETQQRALCEHANRCAEAKLYSRYSRNGRYLTAEAIVDLACEMRTRIVPEFIDYSVDCVLAGNPKLVGLTCLFDQTMASVALAKRLKEVAPQLPIVLGGYALEGPPGSAVETAFPWIDLIVSGDGKGRLLSWLRTYLQERLLLRKAISQVKLW
jgi:hypothetical protein